MQLRARVFLLRYQPSPGEGEARQGLPPGISLCSRCGIRRRRLCGLARAEEGGRSAAAPGIDRHPGPVLTGLSALAFLSAESTQSPVNWVPRDQPLGIVACLDLPPATLSSASGRLAQSVGPPVGGSGSASSVPPSFVKSQSKKVRRQFICSDY